MKRSLLAITAVLLALCAGVALARTVNHHPSTVTAAAAGDPTLLGLQTVATTADSNSAGMAEAFRYTASTSGNVTDAQVYVDSDSAASRLIVGVYSNSSAGKPGTLLTSGSLTSPQSSAWNDVQLSGASLKSGTKYWIALLGTGGQLNFRDGAGSGTSYTSSGSSLSSLPATYPVGSGWNSGSASVYVNGTTGSTTTATTPPTTTTATTPTTTTSTTPTTTTSTTPTTTTSTVPTTTTPISGTDCFANPGGCGFPDPNSADVGTYTASTWGAGGDGVGPYCDQTLINQGVCSTLYQPVACSAMPQIGSQSSPTEVDLGAGQSASDETINGYVEASGSSGTATLTNVCVISPVGSGSSGSVVGVDSGVNVTIDDSTIQNATNSPNGNTEAVRCWGGGTCTLTHDYVHLCGECLHDGNQNVTDTYVLADGLSGHRESVFLSYQTYVYNHDVLLDPPAAEGASSDIFGSTTSTGASLTVTNSLLAGGNAIFGVLTGNSNALASNTIENNQIARCTTQPFANFSDGGTSCNGFTGSSSSGNYVWDQYGYYRNGGTNGIGCPGNTGSYVWSGNVWGDDNSSIACG